MLGIGMTLGIRVYAMLNLLGVSCPTAGAYTIYMELSLNGVKTIAVPITLLRK